MMIVELFMDVFLGLINEWYLDIFNLKVRLKVIEKKFG